jgi:hypothetical protein
MAKQEMQQVKLQHENTWLTCWVDKHVKVGDIITLRDHDDEQVSYLWTVREVHGGARPERGWHAGGL